MDGCNGLGEIGWQRTAIDISRVRLVGRQTGRDNIYYFLGYIDFFSVDVFHVLKEHLNVEKQIVRTLPIVYRLFSV